MYADDVREPLSTWIGRVPEGGLDSISRPDIVILISSSALNVSCAANEIEIVFNSPAFGVDCEILALYILDTTASGAEMPEVEPGAGGALRTCVANTGTWPKTEHFTAGDA